MAEANIIIKAIDQFSAKINSMVNANKGFNKSLEESQRQAQQLAQRQDALIRKQAELKTSLDAASKALKEAKKNFQDTGDAAQAEELRTAHENFDRLKESISGTSQELKDCRKEMRALDDENRRRGGGGGSGGGSGDLATRLGQSGLASAVGDWASNLAGIYVQSAGGDEAATYFSSALSMAGTGAAIGTAIAPGIGTAIGAAIGTVAGLITGAAENAAKKDEYFKNSAKETYDSIQQGFADSLNSGTTTAAQRETDEIAFNTLLGDGVGSAYLQDLRTMAAKTPMEYTDLTNISRQLAIGFGSDPGRMLELMETIGDAGSAVGIDASGMETVATAMSRMQSSGKATLEYLNLIQERGIDAVGMLADGMNTTKANVYDMISRGQIDGVKAVEIISDAMDEMYDGAMEKQSQTFSGLSSTVADIQTERDAAMGAGYTETRSKGLQEEIQWDKYWGEDMQEAYRQIGAFQASMENEKEEILRNAITTVMNGNPNETWGYFSKELQAQLSTAAAEYAKAEADGDAAGMGKALAQAEAIAAAQYTQTDGYDIMLKAQSRTITAVQDAVAESAWQAGYNTAQQWDLGYAAYWGTPDENSSGSSYVSDPYNFQERTGTRPVFSGGRMYAYGLDRVPYNNYPAILHEDERVLTAQQARQMDAGGHAGDVVITGNQFVVREEADISRIASELARQIAVAKMSYAG